MVTSQSCRPASGSMALRSFYYDYEENESETTPFFPCHALILLAELKATTSLSHALNLIRQDDDWCHFWFDDMVTEKFPIYFYKLLGNNDWTILKNYLLEPNNHSFQRMVIPQALSILAHHHPEKRPDVIAFLEDILNDFYENRQRYEDIIEMDLNDAIVCNLLDLKSKDSFPLVAKLYEANMISDEFGENLDEIKTSFLADKDDFYFFNTILTIFEDYQDISAWNKPMSEEGHNAFLEKTKLIEDELAAKKHELAEIKREKAELMHKHLESLGQSKLGVPKVGRNDLCPCGSGKKYKKCCGN